MQALRGPGRGQIKGFGWGNIPIEGLELENAVLMGIIRLKCATDPVGLPHGDRKTDIKRSARIDPAWRRAFSQREKSAFRSSHASSS